MFLDSWLREDSRHGGRALVIAAGGGADIVLAAIVGSRIRHLFGTAVDIAQPLNRDKIDQHLCDDFHLASVGEEHIDQLKRFAARCENAHQQSGVRGKGIAIAAAIEWTAGDRLVFAANGDGCASLATLHPYELVFAVDGGGDILTGEATEFDRRVLSRFHDAWGMSRHLALLVLGLGADGASSEADLADASMHGWRLQGETQIDEEACNTIDSVLRQANRLHPNPLHWTVDDPHWSHGLHVPQIISLAVRGQLPASRRGLPYVLVPRLPKKGGPVGSEPDPESGRPRVVLNQDQLRRALWLRPDPEARNGQ